jgi:hypothetical protein
MSQHTGDNWENPVGVLKNGADHFDFVGVAHLLDRSGRQNAVDSL